MIAKTYDTIDRARTETAALSLEELEALGTTKLRKLASDVQTGQIEQDGKLVRVSNGRKSELAAAIFRVCEDKRRLANAIEVSEEVSGDVTDVVSDESEKTRNEAPAIAEEVWGEVRAYAVSRWDTATETMLAPNGLLNSIALDLVERIYAKSEVISTRINFKGQILKVMRLILQTERSSPLYRAFSDTLDVFESIIQRSFRKLQEEKNRVYSERLVERKTTGKTRVDASELLGWAQAVLRDLTMDDAAGGVSGLWADVVTALLIVTGRRQSEITSSGRFDRVDADSVEIGGQVYDYDSDRLALFSGQLKTKSREVEAYVVPLLADVSDVQKVMTWLELRSKRDPVPEKAHNKFSRYIAGAVGRCRRLVDDSGQVVPLKAHLCRQVYAQVCYQRLQPLDRSTFLAGILGHSRFDLNTQQAYDADIVVMSSH